MSKIGRKSIDISGVQVAVKGQEVQFKGQKSSGTHVLPDEIGAEVKGNELKLVGKQKSKDVNRLWGLHRALLNNKINGARVEFQKELEIVGLGYKAVQSGSKLVFSLGYSHKIDFELPKEVAVTIDKSGQKLLFKSSDNELLGAVCSEIKAFRKPEPYKGTGIKFKQEVLLRKAGKTKSSG